MEVKNRILEILEKSGLTPSEFADKIEVQRSAISHITSGRNKPSLEFLIKIKNAFPEIDTDWLIFGIEKEEKLEEISEQNENIENSDDSLPTLFDLFAEQPEVPKNVENNIQNEEKKVPEINQEEKLMITSSDKKLVKVLLFYQDGTFDEFSPSSK
jgi:transcriptional regulator with XRE-family HTH domain